LRTRSPLPNLFSADAECAGAHRLREGGLGSFQVASANGKPVPTFPALARPARSSALAGGMRGGSCEPRGAVRQGRGRLTGAGPIFRSFQRRLESRAARAAVAIKPEEGKADRDVRTDRRRASSRSDSPERPQLDSGLRWNERSVRASRARG